MSRRQGPKKGHSLSWNVRHIRGLECFRAHRMIHQFRRHSHEGYTIGVIESGFGDNNYRGSVFHLAPGKIVIMNPDEVHTGVSVCERPWSYRMFYIHPEIFRRMLPEKSALPAFSGLCFEDKYWFEKIHTLHCLLETDAGILEKQTRFFEILTDFSLAFGKVSSSIVPGNEPKAIRRIKEYLHAHFQRNVRIDELAEITQLSRSYVIRSFKHHVGMPPYAYLTQIRIKQAKRLLAKKMPVADVAFEMGFSDQSHLTRHFKSLTGITPKQYAIGHHS